MRLQTLFTPKRSAASLTNTIVPILFGAVFIGVGLLFLIPARVDPSWIRVNGKIIDVSQHTDSDGDMTYAPIVEYTVQGRQLRTTGMLATSSYPDIGGPREVAYSPSNPDHAKVVETLRTTWLILIFPLIGAIVIIVTIVSLIRGRKRGKAVNALTSNGLKVQGIVTDVQQSGRGSVVMDVTATDQNGVVKQYTSDPVNTLGSISLMNFDKNPIAIDVYINPTNPDDYYVDISDIPQLTPERIAELVKQSSNDTNNSPKL